MYKVESNFNEFAQKQLKNLEQLMDADKVLREAALNTVVLITDRVQQKGQKTDGSQIGEYSEKTVNFKPITSRFTDIANKKQLASRKKSHGDTDEFYGYKDFRKSLGRQVDFIDLTLTGDMFNDFIVEPVGKTEYEVGFREGENSKIAKYHEYRFGTIFQLSGSEIKQVTDIIQKRVNDILK